MLFLGSIFASKVRMEKRKGQTDQANGRLQLSHATKGEKVKLPLDLPDIFMHNTCMPGLIDWPRYIFCKVLCKI